MILSSAVRTAFVSSVLSVPFRNRSSRQPLTSISTLSDTGSSETVLASLISLTTFVTGQTTRHMCTGQLNFTLLHVVKTHVRSGCARNYVCRLRWVCLYRVQHGNRAGDMGNNSAA